MIQALDLEENCLNLASFISVLLFCYNETEQQNEMLLYTSGKGRRAQDYGMLSSNNLN